jgi:DNA invertase Pin-like site-specific DNA recombinase
MKIGYARVSTLDQNLDLQLRALEKAGCKKIFREKVSGSSRERPQFQRMLDQIRGGDTIVVWKLDRLARSTRGPIGNHGSNPRGWWEVSVTL